MFATKKKYYLIIQNIRDIDLSNIKSFNKFVIIYRNNIKNDKLKQLKQFRLKCKIKGIEFFVANDKKLLIKLRADGLYVSSHNKDLSINRLRSNYKIIGSIHNIKELNIKIDINKLSNYEFFKHQYRSFLLMMYVFEVTEWTGKIISKEGELLRWVSAKDLKKAKLLPANTKVVHYFLK